MITATTLEGTITVKGNRIFQDGEGRYSAVLSQSNCRLIKHDTENDPLVDRFEIKSDLEWWAALGMLDSLAGGNVTTSFAAAKRMVEGA